MLSRHDPPQDVGITCFSSEALLPPFDLLQATAPAAAALVAVHRLCVFLQPERAQPSGFFFTCQHYGPHSVSS